MCYLLICTTSYAEGKVDSERQWRRHPYVVNASRLGKYRAVNSGGGGKRASPAELAADADAPRVECIVCSEVTTGLQCQQQNHFTCFQCLSGIIHAWSGTYPLRIATGVRCPAHGFGAAGCGGTFDRDVMRRGLPSRAVDHIIRAHVIAAELPMRREAHAVAAATNLSMAMELWNGGVQEAALQRLRHHLCEEILCSRCPKCLMRYIGVKPGDCMALECKPQDAPAGAEVPKSCGVYICGWCDATEDESGAMHRHVHDCPHKVGTNAYFSNTDINDYTNYDESLRLRRRAKLQDMRHTIGEAAWEALRADSKRVLEMNGLYE